MQNEQLQKLLEKCKIDGVSEADYEQAERDLKKFNVIMQVFYNRAIVIDLHKGRFMAVSPTPFLLCGHSPDEVKGMGMDFFTSHIPTSEWEKIIRYEDVLNSMVEETPIEERNECSCYYSITLSDGRRKGLVGVASIPLALTAAGRPWLVLSVFYLSPGKGVPELLFKNNAAHTQMVYKSRRKEWLPTKMVPLTETEKWIIFFACQGKTNETICDMLDMSMSAIKKHRKQLFKKLGVNSIAEAIAYVQYYKLL